MNTVFLPQSGSINAIELRLEEDSRLLDLRGHKIANLESQLKNIVYGTSKVAIHNQGKNEALMEELDLTKGTAISKYTGQNVIDIHIEAALFNPEALSTFNVGIDQEEYNSMTTFVIFDFFEFESQITPIGLGLKPHFGHTARYQLYTEDFFLHYLQSNSVNFRLCRSNGIEFVEIGSW